MHQLPLATPMHGQHSLSPAASSVLAHMPAPARARAPMPPGLLGRRAAEEVAGQHIGDPPCLPLGHAGQHRQLVAIGGVVEGQMPVQQRAPDGVGRARLDRGRLRGQAHIWSVELRCSQMGSCGWRTPAHACCLRIMLGHHGALLHAPWQLGSTSADAAHRVREAGLDSASRHAAGPQKGRWARACASSSSECSGDGPPQNKPWPRIFTTPFAWQQMLSVRSLARSNGQFGPYSSRDRIRNAACAGRGAASRTPAGLQAACHKVYVSADALQNTPVCACNMIEVLSGHRPAAQGVGPIRPRQPVMA